MAKRRLERDCNLGDVGNEPESELIRESACKSSKNAQLGIGGRHRIPRQASMRDIARSE
jgi:hypothetical protein